MPSPVVAKMRIQSTTLMSDSSFNTLFLMFSDRSNLVREKKFRPIEYDTGGKGHHFRGTLTDDHTLFLLNQQREKRSKIEKRSWFARLFRRR